MKTILEWGAGALSLAGTALRRAQRRPKVETKVLLQRTASWNDIPYIAYPTGQPQLTTVRIVIPAHSELPGTPMPFRTLPMCCPAT